MNKNKAELLRVLIFDAFQIIGVLEYWRNGVMVVKLATLLQHPNTPSLDVRRDR